MNRKLRFVILSVLVSFSPVTVCDSKDHEENAVTDIAYGQAVANALISDPTIGERLRADKLTAGRITRQVIQSGVTEYVLHVHTCAMCDPGEAKRGSVSITEDARPTYMDGPIEYSVLFNIESVERNLLGN